MSKWRIAALATLLAWCVVMLAVRRRDSITDDWQGWRQADTQAIARNLVEEGFTPHEPRIDWRGDGPGYVETEAQIYPALIAVAMFATGESVWPGQLLSLLCVAIAILVVAMTLANRYGEPAGYATLLVMLGHRGTIAMSTSIQPDALSFLAFAIGWVTFVAYLRRPSWKLWGAWVAATAIAGLVKPTTLELGVAQFILALPHLRDRRLWIGWAIVVGVVAGFMAYAHTLYTDYGNTFGVLSGGDSKLPATSMLAKPSTWIELARYGIVWGTGWLAVPAAIYVAYKRDLRREHAALAVGALLLLLVALRYTSGNFGTHYHLPHVVLGAWLVAAAMRELRPALVGVVAVLCIAIGWRSVRFLDRPPEIETAMGVALARVAEPGTLVAVRARAESFNTEWKTVNNFEDPRVFYVSRTKGWVLANDIPGATKLAEYAQRGAKFYVHVPQKPIDAELAAWLAAHAMLVGDGIYALH
jgi:hypothetical protein